MATSGMGSNVSSDPPPYEPPSSPLPVIAPPLGFSTRAHALYTTAGASIGQSEFNALTFSIMIEAGPTFEMPLIISIDETFEGLMNDIRLLVNDAPLGSRSGGSGLKCLRVDWDRHGLRFASLGGGIQWGRQGGVMMAMLRLLKQRGGIDRLRATSY